MKVTGKLKAALELMVWSSIRRAEAAREAGLADSSLRFALRKPHALAHYNGELAALRTSLRAWNVHRLDGIADNSGNDMVRVSALKALETISEQADVPARAGSQSLPGLVIVINNGGAAEPKVISPPVAPAIDGPLTRVPDSQRPT